MTYKKVTVVQMYCIFNGKRERGRDRKIERQGETKVERESLDDRMYICQGKHKFKIFILMQFINIRRFYWFT